MTDNLAKSKPVPLATLLMHIWHAAKKRRREFLIAAVVAAVLVQVIVFFWPGKFAATAAVMIHKARHETTMSPEDGGAPALIVGRVTKEDVNSEIAILTSHEVFEATVETTGLDQIVPPWYIRLLFAPLRAHEQAYAWYHNIDAPNARDRAIRSLKSSITAHQKKDSNVLVFVLEMGNPRMAEIVLGEMMSQYQQRHLEVHSQTAAQPFFDAQAERIESEVERFEQELQELKTAENVIDFASAIDVQLALDGQLRQERATLVRDLAELSGTISEFRRNLDADFLLAKETVTTGENQLALGNLRTDMLRLEIELIRLEARYSVDSPLVREAQAKLDTAQDSLNKKNRPTLQESRTEESPTAIAIKAWLAEAQGKHAGARQRLQTLTLQLAESKERLRGLDQGHLAVTRVERRLKAPLRQYGAYLERRDMAAVNRALDAGQFTNVSTVQAAKGSPRPVRPRRLVSLGMSLLAALVAGLGACIYLESDELDFEGFVDSIVPKELADE